ncbi:flagellar biosynthetic protein FliR [Henriciella aquimarina]|uniref:flagellar biosynthetic protein FliR n=1 Tax=Henriciella aquimarina TaxID=545261 RepID=UPI000A049BDC|nr:flagellar biosynthetic protein FliR [Henriciella aquimarina]
MLDSVTLSTDLAAWISLFMIVLARLSFVVFLMPGIGEQTVPVRVRMALLLAVTMAFAASGLVEAPAGDGLGDLVPVMIGEGVIGLFFGILLRLAMWVLSITGTVIAQVIGLAQLLGIALETQAQTLTANMLSMAGAALLLAADYHLSVFTRLADLYTEVPVGAVSQMDYMFLVRSCFSGFGFAVLLAWPFVAINLLYNICLGFINKALPSLMVAFVGAPFMIGAGLLLLTVSITTLLMVWYDRLPGLIGWL